MIRISFVQSLGIVSIASGCFMLGAPELAARAYAFPQSRVLLRTLGARDIFIGALLVGSRASALGLLGRALADACDGFIIFGHALRRASTVRSVLPLSVAAVSSVWCFRARRKILNFTPPASDHR